MQPRLTQRRPTKSDARPSRRHGTRPVRSWHKPTAPPSRCAPNAQANAQTEYERIVNSAAAEVVLARQRAIDEAAARMGEIVLEVVERIIGREVNYEAHRDLIEEAVAALRADAEAAASGAGARP